MRKIILITLFSVLFSSAQEQAASDSQFAELTPVEPETATVEAVPETAPAEESSVVVAPVKEEVAVAAPAPASVSEEPVVTVEKEVKVDAPAKKGGLLEGLLPVSPEEAIAKGRFYGGVSLSLIQGNTDDDALNIMIGDVYDAYGYTFTLEGFGGYFIKDAMAIGIRAGYSRTWFDIEFELLEDLLDLSEHRKYVSNGFFVQPVLKNYLKVFDSRTFYFFNETSISVEYSYGMSQTDNGEDLKKTLNNAWTIKAGINPGICIMVLNRFAFETSVGLLGLSSSVMNVEENGETQSRLVYNIVNFTINLLALDFSLVYFF